MEYFKMKQKTDPKLLALLAESRRKVDAMTDNEREAMFRKQAEGSARAEASWPAPKYTMIDGVKHYASYEDYCND